MNSRAFSSLASCARSQIGQQVRKSHAYSQKPPVTIDDLPVPSKPWKVVYDKRNTKYNAQLAVGSVMLVGSIVTLIASNTFVWNFFPPELPPKN
ncbi:hypothetical protein WDU94_013098 [Cyamophila willieti]